jgi:hypothetical protein
MIIDYSTLRPPMPVLKAAGVTAAGRYIGQDGEPGFGNIHKNITTPEARELLAAGIDIFLAFEYGAQQATGGARQGTADAQLAHRQLQALGAPESMTVYFAVDFDIPDYAPHSSDPKAKLGPVGDYFAAIKSLALPFTVGVYGGYYAVSRALDARVADMAWQTVAWSGGQRDKRAVLYQLARQVLGAADVNLLETAGHDFGQWPRPPKPAAKTTEHVTIGEMSMGQLATQHHETVREILTDTARHATRGQLAEVLAYAAAVMTRHIAKDAPMPKGLHLWIRQP